MDHRDHNYIVGDPAVERWLRFKEPSTKELYAKVMRYFLDFAGPELGVKDPSSFVTWAKARPDVLEVQDFVEKFGELQTPTSQLYKMSIVRSLLKRNGVMMPSMSGKKLYLKDFHRGYTRDELQSLLGFLDSPIQKLYVMFAKDSGLRAHDLLDLRYRHVKKDLDAGKEFVHISLEPPFYNRRKASGRTFIGPDTIKLLKRLIVEKQIETSPDKRLFPFVYQTISESLRIAKKKANLDRLIQPNHGMRKFFENGLDKVGMDHHKKLQLEGHSLGVRIHYTDRDTEDLRKLYQQAYQFLDLSEEGAAESRVKELEKLVGEQHQHIEALKVELSKQRELEGFVRELMSLPSIKKELEKKRA